MEWLRILRRRSPQLFAPLEQIWSGLLAFSPRAQKLREALKLHPPAGYRLARLSDADDLALLCSTALQGEERRYFAPHNLSVEGFKRALAQKQYLALIETDTPTQSFGFVRLGGRCAWIGYLVHPQSRGEAKGKKVAHPLAAASRAAGYSVRATIHKENRPSLQTASPYKVIRDWGDRLELELLPRQEPDDGK